MTGVTRTSHELRRSAYHEAAHAVAEWRLGFKLEIVSIRAYERHGGFAAFERLTYSLEGWDPMQPVTLAPDELRRRVESLIVISLVGEMGGSLAGPAPEEDAPDLADELDAYDMARGIADLSPRHVELLERHEGAIADADASDTTDAERMAHGMAGKEEADAYLKWLAQVAARLVHDNRQLIAALAAELLKRTVLLGEEAERIIEAAAYGGKGSTMLTRQRKDALGEPINPEATYRSITSFAGIVGTTHFGCNPQMRLRGDSDVVRGYPSRFVAADTDDQTLQRLRQAKLVAEPEPARQKPARIPVERRWVISEAVYLGSGEHLPSGLELDVDDPRRKAAMPYATPAIPTD